jgi:hypothetical protein
MMKPIGMVPGVGVSIPRPPVDIFGALRQGLNRNSNALIGYGIGMLSGAKGAEVQGYMQGAQQDDAYAKSKADEAKREADLNRTISYLRRVAPQYVAPVEAGLMTPYDAYDAYRKGMEPKVPQLTEVSPGASLYNSATGQTVFTAPEKPTADANKPPTGYRWSPTGTLEFIPGGPADPAAQAANKGDTEQTRRAKQLAAVVNPQLEIAMSNYDAMGELGNQAGNAAGFGTGAMTSPQYQQARNAVYTIAQSYLYSVSGAAAPAEEVNKLVASVTPVPFESPQSIADKKARLQSMVDAINLMAQGGAPGAASGTTAPTEYVYDPATGDLNPL